MNVCNLEQVLWYHMECPDYLKKFDDPKHQKYVRRQMFNLLTVPYMSMKIREMNEKKQVENAEVYDYTRKQKYIEYPEEIKSMGKTMNQKLDDVLNDTSMREKFFEGVEYTKDAAADE